MTVIANGAPRPETNSPCPMANGNIATIVVMAVIKIGRIRDIPARIKARGFPDCLTALIVKCNQ